MGAAELTYHATRPDKLTPSQQRDFDRLLYESTMLDYKDVEEVSEQDIALWVANAAAHRSDINRGIGGLHKRGHQSYAHQYLLTAVDGDGELVAAVPFANNASSHPKDHWPIGTGAVIEAAERAAKLHMPYGNLRGKPLIRSRFGYFEQFALNPDAHAELLHADPQQFNVVMGLVAAASMLVSPRQPASNYPYGMETACKNGLYSTGFTKAAEEPVHPFDSEYETVEETWRAHSFTEIQRIVLRSDGGERALPAIRDSVRSEAGHEIGRLLGLSGRLDI